MHWPGFVHSVVAATPVRSCFGGLIFKPARPRGREVVARYRPASKCSFRADADNDVAHRKGHPSLCLSSQITTRSFSGSIPTPRPMRYASWPPQPVRYRTKQAFQQARQGSTGPARGLHTEQVLFGEIVLHVLSQSPVEPGSQLVIYWPVELPRGANDTPLRDAHPLQDSSQICLFQAEICDESNEASRPSSPLHGLCHWCILDRSFCICLIWVTGQ